MALATPGRQGGGDGGNGLPESGNGSVTEGVPELTEAMIETAMSKAEGRTCVAGDTCCYAFAYGLAAARASCTATGRCKVGWVVRDTGREGWDVWLEVATGSVKLIRQINA